MGLGTSEHTATTYLDIRGGKVCKRVEAPGEGVVSRTIEKGKHAGEVVHEKQYGYVEGVIKGIATQSREVEIMGKKKTVHTLQVILDDVGDRYVLNLPKGYKVWRHFLLTLPNIKAGEPVKLSPYDYVSKKDGKRKSGLGITQGTTECKWAYTRGDGKLPDAPTVVINGENMIDYTAQDLFLEEVLAMFGPNHGTAQQAPAEAAAPAGRNIADLDPDDDIV
jgi:hypothetical protein